jgi:hypothetical protein
MKLSSDDFSETARRLTNLFAHPRPVEHVGAFLEDGLIHRTSCGELVRSKSEVVIANLLHSMGISYASSNRSSGRMAPCDILTSRSTTRNPGDACFSNISA